MGHKGNRTITPTNFNTILNDALMDKAKSTTIKQRCYPAKYVRIPFRLVSSQLAQCKYRTYLFPLQEGYITFMLTRPFN
jgi:hypothetical protein